MDPETLEITQEVTTKRIITFDLAIQFEYFRLSFEFYNVMIPFSWFQRKTEITHKSRDSSFSLLHPAQYEQHYTD